MKNFLKTLGIIVLASIIGISLAACGGSGDTDDGEGGGRTLQRILIDIVIGAVCIVFGVVLIKNDNFQFGICAILFGLFNAIFGLPIAR